jgi:hypothetical protein
MLRSSAISGAELKDGKGIPKNRMKWPSKDKAKAARMIRKEFVRIKRLLLRRLPCRNSKLRERPQVSDYSWADWLPRNPFDRQEYFGP